MAHIHSVYDTDSHFVIDPITRAMRNASSGKVSVIQHDHNSERFTFEIPRMIEGHDMSTCNLVEVHFLNIEASTNMENSGMYIVKDMQISPNGDDTVICSWLISNEATQLIGSLNFLLRFACMTDDKIDYAWNTAIYSGISVSSGIYNSEEVAAQYSDVLQTWYEQLKKAEIIGIEEAKEAAVAEVNAAKDGIDDKKVEAVRAVNTAKNTAESSIVEVKESCVQEVNATKESAVEDAEAEIDAKTEEATAKLALKSYAREDFVRAYVAEAMQSAGQERIKLWENPDVAAPFGSPTVTLDGKPDDYECLVFQFIAATPNKSNGFPINTDYEKADGLTFLPLVEVGWNERGQITTGQMHVHYCRNFSTFNRNGVGTVTFDYAGKTTTTKDGSTGAAINNGLPDSEHCIPYRIYGIRKGVDISETLEATVAEALSVAENAEALAEEAREYAENVKATAKIVNGILVVE